MTTPDGQPPAEERPEPAEASTGPTITTAPPRSRWGWGRVPSHVGPARTSTVIIAVLFVLLFGLHSYLQATADSGYTTVTTNTGQQIRVKNSALSPGQPSPAAPTTSAPTISSPAGRSTGTHSAAPTSGAPTTATGSGPAAPRSTTTFPGRSTTVAPTPPVPTDTGAPTS